MTFRDFFQCEEPVETAGDGDWRVLESLNRLTICALEERIIFYAYLYCWAVASSRVCVYLKEKIEGIAHSLFCYFHLSRQRYVNTRAIQLGTYCWATCCRIQGDLSAGMEHSVHNYGQYARLSGRCPAPYVDTNGSFLTKPDKTVVPLNNMPVRICY